MIPIASGKFQSKSYGYDLYLYCEWASTPNTAGNYSDVTIKMWLNHDSLYVSSGADDCAVGAKNIASKSWEGPDISSSGGRTYLGAQTVRVPHNDDGAKSCTLYGNYRLNATISGSWVGAMEASASVSLDKIARASTISSVTGSVALDGNSACTVNITRASSSFTHKVVWSLGNQAITQSGKTTSASAALPISWCSQLPNATSGKGTVTVTTYSGSTQIGSPVSKQFTVTVPSSVVPTIGSVTAERIDNGVPSAWGVYVRTKSKAKVKINSPSGSYGSTIKSYAISGGGYSGSSAELTTGTLNTYGTNTFTATVTDSRGRKTSKSVSINVLPYAIPTIADSSVFRCDSTGTASDEGTYLFIKATGSFSPCDSHNTLALKAYYKETGGAQETEMPLSNGTAKIVGNGAISVDKTYEVRIVLTDTFGSWESFLPPVPTSFSILDFRAGGKGLAIGKAAESDSFDVNLPSVFLNTVDINRKDGGIGIRSSGNGTVPYWRFHANGEYAWIHYWRENNGAPITTLEISGDNTVNFPGKVRITNTTDVDAGSVGSPPLLIGNPSGQHLEIDGNEIICKASATTGSRLYLGNGGSVQIDGDLTITKPTTINSSLTIDKGNLRLQQTGSGDETWDLEFTRPNNCEYDAHVDLISNSIRVYGYDKAGTYKAPLYLSMASGILTVTGGVYTPTLGRTTLYSGSLGLNASATLTNATKYAALLICGKPGSDSNFAYTVTPAGGIGGSQLTSNTAWLGFTQTVSGANIVLKVTGGSGTISYVWGLVRKEA